MTATNAKGTVRPAHETDGPTYGTILEETTTRGGDMETRDESRTTVVSLSPFDVDADGVPVTDASERLPLATLNVPCDPLGVARETAAYVAARDANPWPGRDGTSVVVSTGGEDAAVCPSVRFHALRPTSKSARTAFAALALSIHDLTESDLRDLEDMLESEFARLAREDDDPIRRTWRLARTVADLEPRTDEGRRKVRMASIRMASSEFDDRECVTFNRDGFVGLCGWASSSNTAPIARTFVAWCARKSHELRRTTSVGRTEACLWLMPEDPEDGYPSPEQTEARRRMMERLSEPLDVPSMFDTTTDDETTERRRRPKGTPRET